MELPSSFMALMIMVGHALGSQAVVIVPHLVFPGPERPWVPFPGKLNLPVPQLTSSKPVMPEVPGH